MNSTVEAYYWADKLNKTAGREGAKFHYARLQATGEIALAAENGKFAQDASGTTRLDAKFQDGSSIRVIVNIGHEFTWQTNPPQPAGSPSQSAP